IVNNLIDITEGEGTQYLLYLISPNYAKAYHNTIVSDNPTGNSSTTRGIYVTSSGTEMAVVNNNVYINRGGSGTIHGLYYSSSPDTSDYNNVYVIANNSSSYFGYNGGSHATLSAFQTATGDDANSLDVDPVFTSPATGDYSPSVVALDNIGAPLRV